MKNGNEINSDFLLSAPRRLWCAIIFSCQGLKAAWQYQWAFRLEILLSLLAASLAFYIGSNAIEKILLIGSVFLLLIIELLNSAIETVVDRISLEQHELSGRAKDLASAAIFIATINIIVTWGIIIFEHFS